MGVVRRRSIRTWLALTAAAAAAASGLSLIGAAGAGATARTITVSPGSGQAIGELVEGSSRGTLAGKFVDSTNTGANTNCAYEFYESTIHWGDGSTSPGSITCEKTGSGTAATPNGTFDITGTHVYHDSGSFVVSATVKDNETGTTSGAAVNTATASITDADLEVDFDNAPGEGGPFTKLEGQSLTVGVSFFDNNNAFPVVEGPAFDAGLTATINWGDGSAPQSVAPQVPPSSCACPGDFLVQAAHVYDAKADVQALYTITATATDDGGATASDTFKARISDGQLTAGAAKHFTATAAAASSPVVASFTDAAGAQAAAADYTATIKWGDDSTSAGTLTKTASGAFDVSGSHTYATAGNRSLTVTVTDEEGQTLSMTAAGTVGAAPVVLPQTGRPTAPASPSSPWLALALGLLALAGVVTGIIGRRLQL